MNLFLAMKKLKKSRLGTILATFQREFWLAVTVSAVINVLMLAPTIYMLQIFDRVMISKSTFSLAVVSLLVLLAYGAMAISELLRSKLIISSGIRLDHALNEPLFRATFFEQLQSGGKNPAQGIADLNVVRQWLTGSGLFAFLDLPWTPIYVAVMFLLHPLLGFLTIGFMFILAIFAYLSTRFSGDSIEESEEEERELNKFLHSKLRNAEVIEAHGMAKNFRRLWQHKQIEMMKVQVMSADINERISASSKQLRFFLNSLALGAGALLVIKGEISIGAMVAAGLLMAKATSPIDMIVSGWRGLVAVKKSLSRLEAQLELVDRKPDELVVEKPSGNIKLVDISAHASESRPSILSSISGVFDAGKIYVIVGPSGAGKSTLGKVILGIWPNITGEILFDGREIRSLSREALGPFVGYLPQDVELFQGSVASNIARMGSIDSASVIEAAKNAQIHEFILSLPRGYDTDIGENGSALSGGERQRLALARAIYGSPKLLVLDEPNANLDARGDAALKFALMLLKAGGSCIFLISHRPDVLEFADAILLVNRGKLTYFGSFAEYQSSADFNSNNLGPPYLSPASKSSDAASAVPY